MARGIKKIKWTGKEEHSVIANLSIPNKLVTIHPSKDVFFEVGEWFPQTTKADKEKQVTWMWFDKEKDVIMLQKTLGPTYIYGVFIPRKLCGPYTYFLDASITGKPNTSKEIGLQFRGHCNPLVSKSKWSTTNDGIDVRQSQVFSYGNIVHLNLETEGLNGSLVTIEIYNTQAGDDRLVDTYPKVKIIDGEVNLQIKNTSTWRAKLRLGVGTEKFYVKVIANGNYVLDSNKDSEHARFLRIKNEEIARHPEPPVNNTPVKVGELELKPERYDPCKFEEVSITETKKQDIFKKGMKLINIEHPKEDITKTIFFDFDSHVINADGNKKLSNVLGFLLEHEYSKIYIDGYACVIGKEKYNKSLSQKRSDIVKKFFVDGKLDPQRIISSGKGEINATDDKKAGDNIKYKDEKQYMEARRVDVSFKFYGHDAQTIIYETVASSEDKNVVLDITDYQTKACFKEKNKHQKKIRVTSTEFSKPIEKEGLSVSIPIRSSLSKANPAPIQYIWPTWNMLDFASGKQLSSANLYNIYFNSCRYYSNPGNATVRIHAFPDIKWELAFELQINVENYSHTNMPAQMSIFAEHQKKAREAGYKNWLMNKNGEVPIKIGLGIKAEWNEGKQKVGVNKDFESKIEATAKILSKTVEIAQNAINVCRGVMKATSIPVSFGVEYPKFEVVGSWYLKKEEGSLRIAVVGEVNFAAKPLIGVNTTIDLIAAAVAVVSYGTTGSPAIAKIVDKIRSYGKVVGAEISAEAKFSGELEVMLEALKINSITGITGGSVTIGGKMGIKIKIKVAAGNDLNIKQLEIKFKFTAEATANAYFGGDLKIDSDDKGIFIEPTLKFSGVKVSLDIKMEVGWFTRSFSVSDDILPEDKIPLKKRYINK